MLWSNWEGGKRNVLNYIRMGTRPPPPTKKSWKTPARTCKPIPFTPIMHMVNVKVKVTLVQALRFCAGRMAQRGSRGIALPFHNHDTRREWGFSVMPRLLFTPGKDPVPIVQEAGWAPGPVWTGAENLDPTGIRSPDHPACSQSLYRLRYPAHNYAYGNS